MAVQGKEGTNQSCLWSMHRHQPCACSSCLVLHGIVFWHTCRDGDQCQTASCRSCQPALWRCFHSALWASLTGLVHTSQARKSKAVSEYIQPCKAKLDAMRALEAIMFSGLSAWLDLFCLTSQQMQGLDSILVSYKRDQDRIIHISPKSSLDHCAHGHTGKKILLLIDSLWTLVFCKPHGHSARSFPWASGEGKGEAGKNWGRKEAFLAVEIFYFPGRGIAIYLPLMKPMQTICLMD